jgi:hypothetical protein
VLNACLFITTGASAFWVQHRSGPLLLVYFCIHR